MSSEELYQAVLSMGLEHGSHYSDLYLRATAEARALIARYKFKANVQAFTSQIDGKLYLDVPFAFIPYWEKQATVKVG